MTLQQLLLENGVPFENGFIKLPPWCKRVKLDVGLSECAPQSKVWLDQEPDDLVVFGFEPVSLNLEWIKKGTSRFPVRLDPGLIGHKFFLIPCALGLTAGPVDFYVTEADLGCSSMLAPRDFAVRLVERVHCFPLSNFLSLFPFHLLDHIDYLKTDCQGTDLQVLQGAGPFLDRICIVTAEAENHQYLGSRNSAPELSYFLEQRGFVPYSPGTTDDPTFLNGRWAPLLSTQAITCYQRG